MASLMADHGYSAAQIASHLGHADGGVLARRTYIKPAMIASPVFVDEALGTGNKLATELATPYDFGRISLNTKSPACLQIRIIQNVGERPRPSSQ